MWDEFFQPNPGDGPNPTDIDTYIANVRDKILRFRNHPSIALWCARNEGFPPPEIDAALRKLLAELEPTRRYQPSSTDGAGVRSAWAVLLANSARVLQGHRRLLQNRNRQRVRPHSRIHPRHDAEKRLGDDQRRLGRARPGQGRTAQAIIYPGQLAARYGKIANLADFVRKAQLANYEAFRAMYEGRNAQLFHPTTAIITWMSNPAQPSFVWQIYHYDLEPMSSLFAVMHAGELVHIQFNEANGQLASHQQSARAVTDAVAHVDVYNLDGTLAYEHETKLTARARCGHQSRRRSSFRRPSSPVHFIKLDLHDATGKLLSTTSTGAACPRIQTISPT